MEFFEWLTQAEAFCHREGRPMVSLSYAQSLDGCLTARRGQPTPLSGAQASKLTHQLRAAHQAILAGVGTVLADDPLLTVRLVEGESPQPVILDSHLRTPLDASLLHKHPQKPWIATTRHSDPKRRADLEACGARLLILPEDSEGRVDLEAMLQRLAGEGICSLMVEGGAQVLANFLREAQRNFLFRTLADQAIVTIAPVYLGGLHVIAEGSLAASGTPHLTEMPRLHEVGSTQLGEDLIVWGKLRSQA
ncbi:MAG: dihydrofolate reductase family protein [Chloroflexota bacterium]